MADELAPTAPAIERRRPQPTLLTVGKRVLSSDGRFHAHLAADYVRERAEAWVTVIELSKIFCTNTRDGHKRVRRNMPSVFSDLLEHGDFLVYDTQPPYGRVVAVKVLDPRRGDEVDRARPQLERMRRRNELSAEKYRKALDVIDQDVVTPS